MSDIKAIETEYNGYKFRSRLEARWAVFFDACGIKYEYEPEGYEMDGIRYLPDFRLSDISNLEGDLFVEVKGVLKDNDCDKLYSFADRNNNLLLLRNIPSSESKERFINDIEENYDEDNEIKYFSVFMSGYYGEMAFIAINHDGNPIIVKEVFEAKSDTDWDKTLSAYKKARSARFEYGASHTIEKPEEERIQPDYVPDEYKKYSTREIDEKEDNVFAIMNDDRFGCWGCSLPWNACTYPKSYHVLPVVEPGNRKCYMVNIPEYEFRRSGLVLNRDMREEVAEAIVNHFIVTGSEKCCQKEFIRLFLYAQKEHAAEYFGRADTMCFPGTLISFPFGIRSLNPANATYLCRKRRMVLAWEENFNVISKLLDKHIDENGKLNSLTFLVEANKILPEPLRTLVCSDNEYDIETLLSDEKYNMNNENKSRCVVRL